ncbi:MAG: hypothetical protein KA436_01565 [Oligoflexales bacterium]|nr:hypothetical protein [Oligoflexales bacterium]
MLSVKKTTKFVRSIALLLSLSACGKKSNDAAPTASEGALNGKNYLIVDAGSLTLTGSELSGSGRVVFNDPIGEVGSNQNYSLTFTVDDGAALELVSHSDNKLENAVTIKLVRSGAKLSVSLLADGKETAARVLDGVDASTDIKLWVDVHNSESPAHVLLWKAGQSNPNDDNALYNSDADGETPGRGAAGFYGLILNKAVVKELTLGNAKFAD